jgi:site-specific recombinase XerD
MRQPSPSLEVIFATSIETLATTLRPNTVRRYRASLRHFLTYLHDTFPYVRRLPQLRRDPHVLGWLRALAQHHPPLSNKTRRDYLFDLRRLLEDLADNGHTLQPGLIRRQDFPPQPYCLPRSLSPEDDQRLQEELRRTDDLSAQALLLTRATGIRIGECVDLAVDCLRGVGDQQWALHVPLGKLHTERLVPADETIRQILARLLSLRALAPPAWLARSSGLLLPRPGHPDDLFKTLRRTLADSARRAGCSQHIVPHQLRHTFASEMVRLGISLPALMRLLGHKDIRMTLRYVTVTQVDLQRQFHLARQNAPLSHRIPNLSLPPDDSLATSDLPGVCRALTSTRHLLEMFRRQLTDEKTRRQLQRLDKRLLDVASRLEQLGSSEK